MRVEEQARPVGRRKRSRDEVCESDGILGPRCGSSCAASAASTSGSGPPCMRTASRRSSILGCTVTGTIERCRTELLEPEAELLDEVEGEAVRAGRSRSENGGLDLDRRRRGRPLPEMRRGCRPRRSRCREGRASGRRAAHPPGRVSATAPSPRSASGCAPASSHRRVAPRARTPATEPRAAPRGRGARRRAPCCALL